MSQKCTFTDFVVFVVISMKKKEKKKTVKLGSCSGL